MIALRRRLVAILALLVLRRACASLAMPTFVGKARLVEVLP